MQYGRIRRPSECAIALLLAAVAIATPARGGELVLDDYPVPAGSHPHDVAPAPDGGVWYTAQNAGALGWLDPDTGQTHHIPLGAGSRPHGVIVGPDGAPWITDGGLNAIVRVDPITEQVTPYPLPPNRPNANLNTATFDLSGVLWFTGQNGVYGRLNPANGQMNVYDAPRGRGPYGITTTPSGDVYYASLAGNYVGRINLATGAATVLEPPTPNQGARRVWSDSLGQIWVSEWNVGQVARYNPASGQWREWPLPGPDPSAYAVFVDDQDIVWLSDFDGNSLVRFDPTSEEFTPFPLPSNPSNVRQILGRPGEVWGAESAADQLVVIRLVPDDLPGDYNQNGTVDAADYVVWRKNEGAMTSLPNDNDISGTIGQAHYDLWRAHFGQSVVTGATGSASDSSAVPEASSLILAALAMGLAIVARDRASMKGAPMSATSSSRFGVVLVALAILTYAREASAQALYDWINSNGGSYHSAANWFPGAGAPPGPDDGAGFGLAATYTVSFSSDSAVSDVDVVNGNVTFDLGASGLGHRYEVFALKVTGLGTTPRLTVVNGGILANTMLVSNGGQIDITGGGFVSATDVAVTGAGSTWTQSGGVFVGTFTGTSTLTIEAGGNVSTGNGGIGSEPGSNGTVTVTGAGSTWTISGILIIGDDDGMGTLTIGPGGMVDVAEGILHDSGALLRLEGGTLNTAEVSFHGGQFDFTGGTLNTAEVTFHGGGQFDFTGGTLQVGTFNGHLVNQGGTLAPGQSAGSTTIVGDYLQQAGAALDIEIGGTSPGETYDQLSITATAILGGQLQLAILDGFVPSASDTFTVLSATGILGIVGAFDNAASGQRLTTSDGGGSFLVHYGPGSPFNPNQIVLSAFEAVPLPGDYNQNGIVDAADYAVWRNTLGQSGTGLPADGNGNNMVDNDDYNVWRSDFGQTAGSGVGSGARVPEPAGILLACLGLIPTLYVPRQKFTR